MNVPNEPEEQGYALVPPPTVPTSIEGMLQVMSRSCPSLIASISVMQLELSTFSVERARRQRRLRWQEESRDVRAGSCPVAR